MRLSEALPSTVWLELTSKCPFDCTFCSRRNVRGEGEHMPISTVEEILRSLDGITTIRLNYSGESVNHPHFDRALQLAKDTGAQTELVTALASIPPTHLRALVNHKLDRISISLHTLDAEQFQSIYRFSSLSQLKEKIAALEAFKTEQRSVTPRLDFSMVAMRNNLNQLLPIAEYASQLGITGITVHPVIQRDPADADVSWELSGPQELTPEFAADLNSSVFCVRERFPAIAVTVARRPQALSGETFTCEQNPFETTHVLANGAVVPCEVLDCQVLGNVNQQDFAQIWNGELYRMFRQDYRANKIDACRKCEFRKPTQAVGALTPLYGWHDRDSSGTLWSANAAEARLETTGNGLLRIDGVLPPAQVGSNRLDISSGAEILARVHNTTDANQEFAVEFPAYVPESVRFTVSQPFRGGENDIRELGFALTAAEWVPGVPTAVAPPISIRRRVAVELALAALERSDRHPKPPDRSEPQGVEEGVSVLIPARGPADLLLDCLVSLEAALSQISERTQVIVLVNGSDAADYSQARQQFPHVQFTFHAKPLSFSRAIEQGLRQVQYGWVYLLNSDMTVHPHTLSTLLAYRAPEIFSLGSAITLSEGRTFETGWTSLRVSFGRAELVERPFATAKGAQPNLYSGGGSSLFQTAILKQVVRRTHCYSPFYWEDVEWGVVAKARGLQNLFVPESHVTHRHRATVNRFYESGEVERIFERNQLLFSMRCLPRLIGAEALRHSLENIFAKSAHELLTPRQIWLASRSRGEMFDAPLL